MELIQIVDENGEFTGQVLDKEEAHDKNLLHNEIAVFIINDCKQVLLQKRSANKRFNPNQWGLCAGHVDAYESLESAALRELKEEVGLEIEKSDLYKFGKRDIKISDINSHITYFFYVKSNKKQSEFVIQTEELSEVKWFYIDEVIELIQFNSDSVTLGKNKIQLLEKLKAIK